MKNRPLTDFEQDLQSELKDPKFKKYYDQYGIELEVAYSLLQLRKQKKMSQKTLAKKVGTTQGNIARIEAANQNLTLRTLFKMSHALGKELQIKFI